MRPAFAVRVENAVAVDHFMVLVFEERKVEVAVEALAQHLAEFFRFLVIIDAHRQNLDFIFLRFGQKAFQLPELFQAEGSPIAAIENQDHGFLAAKI